MHKHSFKEIMIGKTKSSIYWWKLTISTVFVFDLMPKERYDVNKNKEKQNI